MVAEIICPPLPARSPDTVVVPFKAMTPVEESYERGTVADKEEDEILLLNKVQSVDER